MDTNLVNILEQEGHSGLLEGNCRVHYEGDFISVKDYFNDDETSNEVKVTFSCGTQPLGTYTFQGMSFEKEKISGHLLVVSENAYLVDIDTEISDMPNFCRFRVILYSKK